MRFSFNTDDLEPAARFEAFRDHLVRRLFQLDLVSQSDGPYRGLVDLDVTGPAVFGRVCGSAADFVRTPNVARQCERGVWLLLARDGRMGVGQGEVASILSPGEGFVFDAERSHEGHCLGQLDAAQSHANQSDTWVIQVRDEVVHPLRAYGAYPQFLQNTAKSYAPLLIAMLETHFRLADPKEAQASEAFGRYLADIVALQLGANRDGGDAIAKRGLMAARRQLVLEKIQACSTDPAFSATAVARRARCDAPLRQSPAGRQRPDVFRTRPRSSARDRVSAAAGAAQPFPSDCKPGIGSGIRRPVLFQSRVPPPLRRYAGAIPQRRIGRRRGCRDRGAVQSKEAARWAASRISWGEEGLRSPFRRRPAFGAWPAGSSSEAPPPSPRW